ncbi:MAG: VOC family protein [Planctomycetota bacterium]
MPSRTSGRTRVLGTVSYVADLAAAVRFYRDRLGLVLESETSEQATLRGGEGRVVLSRRWWPPTLAGVHPFAPTACVSAADVAAAARALEAAGVRVLLRPTPFPDGTAIAEVLDPDGNVVRLVGRAPRKAASRGRKARR